MTWQDELTKTMTMLGELPNSIFLGQSVVYPGHLMTQTLEGVPKEKLLEVPVFEDTQLGLCLGLALEGYLPISIYPRMDFLLLACNQLVNHLDKIAEMSQGRFNPKVLIRTMPGATGPLGPGPQHCQDHTTALSYLLNHVQVVKITRPEDVMPAYQRALEREASTVLIEAPPERQGYEG